MYFLGHKDDVEDETQHQSVSKILVKILNIFGFIRECHKIKVQGKQSGETLVAKCTNTTDNFASRVLTTQTSSTAISNNTHWLCDKSSRVYK